MDYIPTIMMLLDNGYTNFRLKDIDIRVNTKLNVATNRHVYKVGKIVYKIFDESAQDTVNLVLHNVWRGVYKEIAPQLLGIVFNGETPCGYAGKICGLHINPVDFKRFRAIIQKCSRETGLVLWDFHSRNLGKLGNRPCLLDLEAVRPWKVGFNSKDIVYNRFVESIHEM